MRFILLLLLWLAMVGAALLLLWPTTLAAQNSMTVSGNARTQGNFSVCGKIH